MPKGINRHLYYWSTICAQLGPARPKKSLCLARPKKSLCPARPKKNCCPALPGSARNRTNGQKKSLPGSAWLCRLCPALPGSARRWCLATCQRPRSTLMSCDLAPAEFSDGDCHDDFVG